MFLPRHTIAIPDCAPEGLSKTIEWQDANCGSAEDRKGQRSRIRSAAMATAAARFLMFKAIHHAVN